MNTQWLKIKMWVKVCVFGAVAIYVIAFVWLNHDTTISLKFVFKDYKDINALLVLFLTGIFSILGWALFRTVFKTLRQMQDVRRRSHLERIEREHADMIAKAAKLQTRPEGPPKTP